MVKDYNFKNYFSISEAMTISNAIMPGPKFTLLDYNLICLAKSFHEAGKQFYMTNDQLASLLFSCEKTIRSSINRLCAAGLLKKEFIDNNRLKGRYLIYQSDRINSFISEMKMAISR